MNLENFHVVSAWAAGASLVLGQLRIDEKQMSSIWQARGNNPLSVARLRKDNETIISRTGSSRNVLIRRILHSLCDRGFW